MKSLANTEKFPAGKKVLVEKYMIVWDKHRIILCDKGYDKRWVKEWNGSSFFVPNGIEFWESACFPVETDENTFVRDGVRYVAVAYVDCGECDSPSNDCTNKTCTKHNNVNCNGISRKDKRNVMWKRADTQTRPMTAREIYELAHQGAAFAGFRDDALSCLLGVDDVADAICINGKLDFFDGVDIKDMRYCLPCDMTDDDPATWAWRKLEKVG